MLLISYSFLLFKQKTAYELRISDWSSDVCSSDLPIAPANSLGLGPHRARIGAGIRLRKAEAAYDFAGCELGKIAMTQIVAAEGEDRVHHQRRLHAHRRAVSRTNPLYRARYETIGDIAQAGADIAFGRSEEHTSEHQLLMRLSYADFCLEIKQTIRS